MNTNKQLKNTLGTFKRNMTKIGYQIGRDRKEGKFDSIVEIEGKQYDLMDLITDSIYASNEATDLLSNVDKDLVSGALNGINRFKRNEKLQLEYVIAMLEEVENIYLMKIPYKLMFGMEDHYYNRMVTESAGIDIESIYDTAFACTIMLAIGVENAERCMTSREALYLNAMLYIAAKNGYIQDTLNIEGVNGLLKADEQLSRGCTFDTYLDWLKSYGVEADVLKPYIKLRCSDKISIDDLKCFYKLIVKEYKRSVEMTVQKEKLAAARKQIIESEKYAKILASLKRSGLSAEDVIIYCIENKYSEDDIYSIISSFCIAFGVSKNHCGTLVEYAARNLEVKLIKAVDMLASKNSIQSQICDKAKEKIDKLTDELNKQKDINKKYRSQVKQSEKEVREIREQLGTQKRNNTKQVEYINSLKEKGLTDIQPLQAERDKLNSLLDESRQSAEELKRDKSKLKASLDQITKQYETTKKQLEDKEQELLETASLVDKSHSKINSIGIECYINALKDKKIAVYGGDMMHAELKGLGLKGLKLLTASNRNIAMNDLAYQDIIVVVTGYMSHSTMHIPKGASEKFNIPILYFNNKNVSMMIQDVFTTIYGNTESNS